MVLLLVTLLLLLLPVHQQRCLLLQLPCLHQHQQQYNQNQKQHSCLLPVLTAVDYTFLQLLALLLVLFQQLKLMAAVLL